MSVFLLTTYNSYKKSYINVKRFFSINNNRYVIINNSNLASNV